MSQLPLITIVGAVAVVVLLVVYLRARSKDVLEDLIKKRGSEARVSEIARFVEGMQEIPVALVLTNKALYYENRDLQASIDLERIEEVEYDDELSTAKELKEGRVLRLRSHGHTYEFIIDPKNAPRWNQALPMHRLGEAGTA